MFPACDIEEPVGQNQMPTNILAQRTDFIDTFYELQMFWMMKEAASKVGQLDLYANSKRSSGIWIKEHRRLSISHSVGLRPGVNAFGLKKFAKTVDHRIWGWQ